MKNKVLSLILALTLVLTVIPVFSGNALNANAEGSTSIASGKGEGKADFAEEKVIYQLPDLTVPATYEAKISIEANAAGPIFSSKKNEAENYVDISVIDRKVVITVHQGENNATWTQQNALEVGIINYIAITYDSVAKLFVNGRETALELSGTAFDNLASTNNIAIAGNQDEDQFLDNAALYQIALYSAVKTQSEIQQDIFGFGTEGAIAIYDFTTNAYIEDSIGSYDLELKDFTEVTSASGFGIDGNYYFTQDITGYSTALSTFKGKIYGFGHTITASTNLIGTINGDAQFVGFTINSTSTAGCALAEAIRLKDGTVNALFKDITITGTVGGVTTSGKCLGNFVAVIGNRSDGNEIQDCNITFENCVNAATKGSGTPDYAGGFIAQLIHGMTGSMSMKNCINTESLTATECCGGFIGDASGFWGTTNKMSASSSLEFNFENCLNLGNLSNTSSNTTIYQQYGCGGIVGSICKTSSFKYCVNNGTISSYKSAAGIVGRPAVSSTTSVTVDSCINLKKVSCSMGTSTYYDRASYFVGRYDIDPTSSRTLPNKIEVKNCATIKISNVPGYCSAYSSSAYTTTDNAIVDSLTSTTASTIASIVGKAIYANADYTSLSFVPYTQNYDNATANITSVSLDINHSIDVNYIGVGFYSGSDAFIEVSPAENTPGLKVKNIMVTSTGDIISSVDSCEKDISGSTVEVFDLNAVNPQNINLPMTVEILDSDGNIVYQKTYRIIDLLEIYYKTTFADDANKKQFIVDLVAYCQVCQDIAYGSASNIWFGRVNPSWAESETPRMNATFALDNEDSKKLNIGESASITTNQKLTKKGTVGNGSKISGANIYFAGLNKLVFNVSVATGDTVGTTFNYKLYKDDVEVTDFIASVNGSTLTLTTQGVYVSDYNAEFKLVIYDGSDFESSANRQTLKYSVNAYLFNAITSFTETRIVKLSKAAACVGYAAEHYDDLI